MPRDDAPAAVFVTRRIPEAGVAPLRDAGLEVEVRDADDAVPRDELLERVRGKAGLIALLSDRVDDALLDAAGPGLRIVANFAVGYDNLDLDACRRRGVAASNTPDVLTDATADQAMALVLAVARRTLDGHRLVASGGWTGWEPLQMLGVDVTGATLGIVGMGRIGTAVAARARGFGMRLLYHNRRPDESAERDLGASYRARLLDLVAEADIISLHCPLSEATHHLIGRREIAAMKETAILINTARGAVVDEEALVAALSAGRIWGAGLDVFEDEPRLTPGLAHLPNVVLTPHLGSATRSVRDAMARLCADAILAVLGGRTVPHLLLSPSPPRR